MIEKQIEIHVSVHKLSWSNEIRKKNTMKKEPRGKTPKASFVECLEEVKSTYAWILSSCHIL